MPSRRTPRSAGTSKPPAFETPKPIDVKLPEGTHWARRRDFTGPLAVVYAVVLRRRFARGMRQAVDGLVRRVESGPPPDAVGQG